MFNIKENENQNYNEPPFHKHPDGSNQKDRC
jgi:hypothetical protein